MKTLKLLLVLGLATGLIVEMRAADCKGVDSGPTGVQRYPIEGDKYKRRMMHNGYMVACGGTTNIHGISVQEENVHGDFNPNQKKRYAMADDSDDVTSPAASSSTPVSTVVRPSLRRSSPLARVPYGSPMYQSVPAVEALAMVPYGVDPLVYVQAAAQLSRQEAEVERLRRAAEALGIPLDE